MNSRETESFCQGSHSLRSPRKPGITSAWQDPYLGTQGGHLSQRTQVLTLVPQTLGLHVLWSELSGSVCSSVKGEG